MDVLVNNTLGSMAATVRTDSDRSVVTATLEAVEDLLKALRPLSFPMQDRVLSSLVVSVQDILEDKVSSEGMQHSLVLCHSQVLFQANGVQCMCVALKAPWQWVWR